MGGKPSPAWNLGGGVLTTIQTKEWLQRYSFTMREASLLRARADAIRSRAEAPATARLNGMPREPGFDVDRVGGIVGAVDSIEQEAETKEQEAEALYREINSAICCIEGTHAPEQRAVLQMRYLDRAKWSDIAFAFYGGETDFLEREDSLQKRLFKIHKAALVELGSILETRNRAENCTKRRGTGK